jgi:hypothetical protein
MIDINDRQQQILKSGGEDLDGGHLELGDEFFIA